MKFINWLNGKKVILAGMYWGVAVPVIAIVHPAAEITKAVEIVGLLLTYAGLGHKAVKKYMGKK